MAGLKIFEKQQIANLSGNFLDGINRNFQNVAEFANSISSVFLPVQASSSQTYLDNRYLRTSLYQTQSLSSLNAFTASINLFTASQITLNNSFSNFTSSADQRYILTSSFQQTGTLGQVAVFNSQSSISGSNLLLFANNVLRITGSVSSSAGFKSGNTGFKQYIGPYTFYTGSYAVANTLVFCVFPLIDNVALTSVEAHVPMPFSGSIVGISAEYFGGGFTNTNVQVLKNGRTAAVTLIPSIGIVTGSTFTKGYLTFPKGTYTFNPGDDLAVETSYNTTGGRGANVHLFVEMDA